MLQPFAQHRAYVVPSVIPQATSSVSMALLGVPQQLQRYIEKSLKSPFQNYGKTPGKTSMTYKAIKIIHTDLSISDNLLNKRVEKEDTFF